MVCAIWQDNNTKALIDAIAVSFQEDTYAEAKASIQASLASVRGHSSGHQNPGQYPETSLQGVRHQ